MILQILDGGMECFCANSANIWQIVGYVVNIFKIVIPVIIVLFAMIDLGKAVMAGEEKEIKEAQQMLIKRLIYGVVVFFVVTIVQVVFNLIGDNILNNEAKGCFTCVSNATGKSCTTAVQNIKDDKVNCPVKKKD